MAILNLTQHPATPEQIAAGVVDLPEEDRRILQRLLTFDELPTAREIEKRASDIALLAAWRNPVIRRAMIGGAPYLMAPLEAALRVFGLTPAFPSSSRYANRLRAAFSSRCMTLPQSQRSTSSRFVAISFLIFI